MQFFSISPNKPTATQAIFLKENSLHSCRFGRRYGKKKTAKTRTEKQPGKLVEESFVNNSQTSSPTQSTSWYGQYLHKCTCSHVWPRPMAAMDQERSHLCPTPAFTAEARRGKKCSFKRQLHHTHEKVRKQVTLGLLTDALRSWSLCSGTQTSTLVSAQ